MTSQIPFELEDYLRHAKDATSIHVFCQSAVKNAQKCQNPRIWQQAIIERFGKEFLPSISNLNRLRTRYLDLITCQTHAEDLFNEGNIYIIEHPSREILKLIDWPGGLREIRVFPSRQYLELVEENHVWEETVSPDIAMKIILLSCLR